MSASVAFLVVALLLCIIPSSRAADVLQCTGERLSDGKFFFNASFEVKEDVRDCETQWLVDEKVVGFSEADGYTEIQYPIVMATANTAILQTCPENLQWLLICPTGNINEKKQCPCYNTTTLPEVGFPDWSIPVGIGVSCGVFVFLLVLASGIVLYHIRQRSRYAPCGTGSSPV